MEEFLHWRNGGIPPIDEWGNFFTGGMEEFFHWWNGGIPPLEGLGDKLFVTFGSTVSETSSDTFKKWFIERVFSHNMKYSELNL